jgi:hypothetical protein
MRNRFMVYIIFMAVMVVAPFVSTGFVLAEATDVDVSVDVSILKKPTLVDEESEQCFQFNATQGTTPPCDQTRVFSTWVIDTKTNPADKCKVEVRVLYDGADQPECIEVKKTSKIPGQDLNKIASFIDNDVATAKKLRNIFPKNGGTDCNEVWLRFADKDGCNGRCFTSGGRAYCR